MIGERARQRQGMMGRHSTTGRFIGRTTAVMVLWCAAAGQWACQVSWPVPGGGSADPTAGSDRPEDDAPLENLPPIAAADATEVALIGETVRFDGSASFDPDGEIAAYDWSFDDGTTAEGVIVERTFADAGEYRVTLTVTDDRGAMSETEVVVRIDPPVDADEEFEVVVGVDPPGAGEVTLTPAGGVYRSGETVRLSVVPAAGFRFVRYEGDVSGADAVLEVAVDRPLRVTAVLERLEVRVSAAVEPAGSGDVDFDPPGGVYAWGTRVTLTAQAGAGFSFLSFVDEGGMVVSSTARFSFDAYEDVELTARFQGVVAPSTVTLIVSSTPVEGGTVSLNPAGGSYLLGTVVTISATPKPGYAFARFTGDATGNQPSVMVTMNGHRTVTAEFAWRPALGNPGNLLVSGFLGKNVTEYDRFSGAALGELVAAGDGGLNFAGGIAFGPSGDLFVVNIGLVNTTSVLRYDGVTGQSLGTFVTGGGPLGFITLRFAAPGQLRVANNLTHAVEEYDGGSGAFVRTLVTPGSGGLNNPVGMALAADGNLVVVSKGTDSLLGYDGATGAALGVVADLAAAGFTVPVDVVFGPDGALYVTVSGDESVVRVEPQSGAAAHFVIAGSGGLDAPAGLGFHPDTGHLLVVSQGTNSVLEYDGRTGAFLGVFATGSAGDNLFFMAFRPR